MGAGSSVSGDDSSKEFCIFPGCLVSSRFPSIEKVSREVLTGLGLDIIDIKDSTCCPNQMGVQAANKALWYTLAARNLCLAEKQGRDIVTLCNGCYDTLKTVNTKLKEDEKFRNEINALLSEFDLRFNGTIDVKHVIQVLIDDVGVSAIEKRTVRPLGKLRCAPFEGCHVRRPMDHMGFDDPNKPTYLGDLIKAMGGEVVNYPERSSCCGGGLSVMRKDDVLPSARRVLRSAVDAGAETMIVNCPFCLSQLSGKEKQLSEDFQDDIHLPIFYITEILGLAMGINSDYSKSPVDKKKVASSISGKSSSVIYDGEVTRQQLEICSKCLACVDDCQTAMTTPNYHPDQILASVLKGGDEAISREDIWYCMNCHDCTQRCPQGFGMVKLMIRLKNLAVEQGRVPDVIKHRLENLNSTGFSFVPDEAARKDLGLPAIGERNEDVMKIMKKIQSKAKRDGD